jgi:5-methylcytosine-specific restriction endonuclease McrA
MSSRIILLNADYTFLNTIDWKKAACLIAKGKIEIVKYSDKVIRSVNTIMKIPLVARLIKFIRTIYKSRVPFSKKNVMVRDGLVCSYCGEDKIRLTIDHIVPKVKGGKSTFENCVASCKPCNNRKGSKTCSEAKMFPKAKAYQPTISEFLRLRMQKLGIEDIIRDSFK